VAYRRDDIERVRDVTDLVELVGEVTKVRRSGRSVMAVCPFHQEKTPSMSIDPAPSIAAGLKHRSTEEILNDVLAYINSLPANYEYSIGLTDTQQKDLLKNL